MSSASFPQRKIPHVNGVLDPWLLRPEASLFVCISSAFFCLQSCIVPSRIPIEWALAYRIFLVSFHRKHRKLGCLVCDEPFPIQVRWF
ncbi:hypothetical protein NA56DRAFT_452724 [Hyaloscypha hepaticicola]|uniref:Uncharacterized protein n=1 Tax=Hyaloscypha hepaticicola TaxID=2082293 RepID=A0A2J6PFV4_9HELO|nr:hypothetical protein NA56DRAFT_452724 [Hyaloscypha hepaticicola]